jgi:glucoamylase
MPRDLPIGNGDLLVTFDAQYRLRDLYFPFVGKYNHTVGFPQRFGIFCEGRLAWSDDAGWARSMKYIDDTLVTHVVMTHSEMGLEVTCHDCVDFHEPIWLRRVVIRDLRHPSTTGNGEANGTAVGGHAGGGGHAVGFDVPSREVRVFIHSDLSIRESPVGDTANYDPASGGIVFYKDDYFFLLNGCDSAKCGIDHWAIGAKRIGSAEGTYRDAEDGELGRNAIAQGSVDATVGYNVRVPHGGEGKMTHWMICGHNYERVAQLNKLVYERTPDKFISRTEAYWKLWVNNNPADLSLLPGGAEGDAAKMYRRSLLVLRTQVDNRGAIVAANDSDITHYAGDTYSYCWPRDGALVAYAMVQAGLSELSREFFRYCGRVINKSGYFLHKYTPDGRLASSWHPWMIQGQSVLPIQQDETALVVWALRKHFEKFRDVEFIKPLYNALVIAPAKWMTEYRDANGLPLPSWDLWEERRGVHTFTVAATIAGLRAAADFATDFGDAGRARWFSQAAEQMRQAMLKHLYSPEKRCFARMATHGDGAVHGPHAAGGGYKLDFTRDSANFAIWWLGVLKPGDEWAQQEMKSLQAKLWCGKDGQRAAAGGEEPASAGVGGWARYENDHYHRIVDPVSSGLPGNPWLICTLWRAQYLIATAAREEDLAEVDGLLEWATKRASESGVLAEQFHPVTGAPVSVSPLTWSHATVVIAVQEYVKKKRELRQKTGGVKKPAVVG